MTAEENKELIRRFVKEIYIKQDLSNYSDFVGDEIIEFGTNHLEQFFTAFSDLHMDI